MAGALSLVVARLPSCHSANNGRPGIDPEVAVRLMFAGLPLGIVHDRIGYADSSAASLHERLPGHSNLTRTRQPLERAPLPGDLSAYGHGLSGREDRHGGDGSHQRHADPNVREQSLAEPDVKNAISKDEGRQNREGS